ncbi:hypothetical protein [Rhodopila sp.]|uniref:hypothetical protein n=1 Tax=Rhodopila sp. TaxID=2480087 RepID=UPI003D0E9E9F
MFCTTIFSSIGLIQPAVAQTDTRIDSIERQIRALQSQLGQVKADLVARDRALKSAQQQAKAAQDQAAAASAQAAHVAAAPPVQVVTAAPPPAPPLPPGQFKVGGLTVTLGGFAAAEGVYRSRNEAASIATSFSGIPLPNSPNYHIPEFRETAQQSRISLLTEGQIDDAQKLTGYVETDFLSAGSSSNSTESNSYTLRLRQFWGNYDNSDLGLHVLGGQTWSLATLYKTGLVPRQENVPLTIDAQYNVGFDWARQATLRVTKDFGDHKYWAGFSLESPQTTYSSAGGPNCLTGANATTATGGGTLEFGECGGSNVNTIQNYSDNHAPDIIAKLAADPGWGHYEVYGLLRFLGGRVSFASRGNGKNYNTTGEGIGAGMLLPLVPKMLTFQLSGLIGQGVGRYGTSQLPDATFSPAGKLEPLAEYSILGGIVGNPVPAVDLYAYGGAEGVAMKSYAGTAGYGNPNLNLSGCEAELGACNAATSALVEGTVGGWWRFIKSRYGTAEFGAQYSYVNRNTFKGLGATRGSTLSPNANENLFLFSFRYLPFQ